MQFATLWSTERVFTSHHHRNRRLAATPKKSGRFQVMQQDRVHVTLLHRHSDPETSCLSRACVWLCVVWEAFWNHKKISLAYIYLTVLPLETVSQENSIFFHFWNEVIAMHGSWVSNRDHGACKKKRAEYLVFADKITRIRKFWSGFLPRVNSWFWPEGNNTVHLKLWENTTGGSRVCFFCFFFSSRISWSELFRPLQVVSEGKEKGMQSAEEKEPPKHSTLIPFKLNLDGGLLINRWMPTQINTGSKMPAK